ncbi:putative iron-regulated protein [Malaciobacter marinus]|uniref:Iron-regulated protein n=1 Tax=Malaciobacter marinus TaxID=505249 RepID=A0AB36ZV77_9BACT|nr:imelysin family protein [Malaciobacter marinus]PPK60515.1 putative iron-regulated protein [Malaciobacter marinus]
MTFTKTKVLVASLSLAATLALTGCATSQVNTSNNQVTAQELLSSYSDIALANYNDALKDAKQLDKAINDFANNPTQENLDIAKAAWLKSRESYGQTEIFRLSNGPIDAEEGWVAEAYGALEGQINAWPLDENMIDYTTDANNKRTSGNIIDTKGEFNPGGEESTVVNVKDITVDALTALNENGGEANVSTGYHAIEFLLWGQDQDYSNFIKDSITNGALVAGQRPLSDFTSDKDAKRRLDYLKATSKKIVSDLQTVTSAWKKEINGNTGLYQAALLGKLKGENASKNIDEKTALRQIFAGMGVFVKSELANERIAVAVLTPSEEDEHSCFSDNTHRDIVANYKGFKNVLMGTYNGMSYGKAPINMLDNETKDRILNLMASIEDKIANIDAIAKTSRHFDYQIRPSDPQAKVIVKLKNQLRKLGDEMVNVAKANGVELSNDDVTDPEETKL